MKIILILIGLVVFNASAVGDEQQTDHQYVDGRLEIMKTGRYSYVENIPPADQLNPLKVVVKTRVPQTVRTVGETVNFLLARSGYVLADQTVLSEEVKSLLTLPLPYIHRNIGPMTLDRALQTLSGDAFRLVVDPVHRKVAYELSSRLVRSN